MSKGPSKLSRCIRAPIRALCRARDFYMKNMTGCAGRANYGAGVGCPLFPGVPRSYSFHSSSGRIGEDDMRELIRAASLSRPAARRGGGGGGGGRVAVTRSQSVVIGRIDEEEPCEFEDDVRVGSNLLFPRSRSCAVAGKMRAGVGTGARLIA